jgi:Cu-Zn family superoxide dismutase
MSADRHQSLLRQNFRPDLRAWIGATLIAGVSLLAPIAPASAWTLGAEAKLYNNAEQQVGIARLIQLGDGNVVVQVRVHGLPQGFHGFHVHAVGECVPGAPAVSEAPGISAIPAKPDFASAGGHFDLEKHNPGDPNKHIHGNHSGDLPILLANDEGIANAIFTTDHFEVADLFDADGSAIVIHADPDNYANIPGRYAFPPSTMLAPDAATQLTGDSGARIACGVVKKLIER